MTYPGHCLKLYFVFSSAPGASPAWTTEPARLVLLMVTIDTQIPYTMFTLILLETKQKAVLVGCGQLDANLAVFGKRDLN